MMRYPAISVTDVSVSPAGWIDFSGPRLEGVA